MKMRSYRKDYEGFLTQFKWDYMVTIRKNYRTNENVVRNTSNKLIKQIQRIKRFFPYDSLIYNKL
jgi:hypothetical protein